MEKNNQAKVEYMMQTQKQPWIDTRLNSEEMDFLWKCISEKDKEDLRYTLAGNISKSEVLIDKGNWFYETVLKKYTEKLFYREENNYYKYHIEVEEGVSLPEFEMNSFWVNYMKQREFNPLHNHGGMFSFVIFVKIPTHWKEQHALPISANTNAPRASDFQFVWSSKERIHPDVRSRNFPLSPEDEGRMLFFPAWLQHLVYPFYGTEEERITVSGNIRLYDPNRPTYEEQEIPVGEYEKKENMLKMMENSVKFVKKELEQMKKERENVE